MMKYLALASVALSLLAPLSASRSDEPPVIDPKNVAITLERTECFGSCPAYKATVYGDGRVQFTADKNPFGTAGAAHERFAYSEGVLLRGSHEDRVAPEAVAALIKQFQAADFWHLKDAYQASITDFPAQLLTIVTGDLKKTVVDYAGIYAGMPQIVSDLEKAVDQLAGTDRWVTGSPSLIPWLERTGFDFHSSDAAVLAVAGEEGDAPEATIIALLNRGAPLDRTVNVGGGLPMSPSVKPETAGILLIGSAIRRGHADVFKWLATNGWLDRLGKAKAGRIFSRYAAGCSAAMVDAVADAGVNIDEAAPRDPDRNPGGPDGKTALAELTTSYICGSNEIGRVQTADALLARGANPNHRDSLGRTPIYGVNNLDLLNLLLAHGADATAKSNDGKSLVFGSYTDDVVLRLLEAGASPVGRDDSNGTKTLAQLAKERNMPQVARWLAEHPEAFQR